MSTGWLKSFSKRGWRKELAVAVTASLFAGIYIPSAMAADYNNGITGNALTDANTFGSEAVTTNSDGTISYNFTGNNSINIKEKINAHGIVLKQNNKTKNIDLNGGTLKIYAHSTVGPNANSTAGGISLQDGGQNLTITGNLDIQAHSNSCFAHGIGVTVPGTGTGAETHLTIDGNIKMRSDDTNNPWGVTAQNIYGGYGPNGSASSAAPSYTGARWAPSGIVLGTGHGSTITINGDVDMAVKGNAIVTNNYNDGNGTIKLNGSNINIETPESQENTFYALAGFGGDIYVGAGENSIVNVKGNIIAMSNDTGEGEPYFYDNSKIQLALMNSQSNWTGVIDNSGKDQAGEVNLYVQNGATWNHQSMSKTDGLQVDNMPDPSIDHYGNYDGVSYVTQLAGGKTEAAAGHIYQKDKANIDVKEYIGHTVVYYEHKNEGINASDYTAGDFVIHGASQGSGITLSTDYDNITASDKEQVAKVLNTLAGKLYYKNFVSGERNLEGKVQIASGLTASEASKIVGNIVFDKQTGQGTNVDGGDTDSNSGFTTSITGIANDDTEYYDAGVIQQGNYLFEGNTDINITDGKAAAAIDLSKNLSDWNIFQINVDGEMDLDVTVADDIDRFGIRNAHGKDSRISANALTIKVDSNGMAQGLSYTGGNSIGLPVDNVITDADQSVAVKANIRGQNGAKGIYLANGNRLAIQGSVDLNVDGNGTENNQTIGIHVDGTQGRATNTLEVYENVNISSKGTGILSEGEKAVVNLQKGVTINLDKEAAGNNYALAIKDGKIDINNERNNESNTSVINGNIGLLGEGGSISLNLLNKDSSFNGVVYKAANSTDALQIKLANGAIWTNHAYGNVAEDFKGSYVDDFYGGARLEKAGIILQKDSRDITFDTFGGVALIVYDHTGDGSSSEDYVAGNTIINHAKAGGNVIMTTDTSNINMQDTLAVDKVLDALASKLYYKGIVNGETDLHGQVQIASGLTSSIVSERIETIKFNPATGQGSYGSDQLVVDFSSSITGNEEKDSSYADGGVLKDGKYIFDKDSSIKLTNGDSVINAENNLDIYATKVALEMSTSGNSKDPLQGIIIKDKAFKLNGKEINLKVENLGGRAEGIFVSGSSADNLIKADIIGNLNIDTGNSKDAVGIHTSGNSELTINGNLAVNAPIGTVDSRYGYYSNGAIYAGGNKDIKKGSIITVNGNVDLNNNGVFANGFGSTVNIRGGGNISIDKENNKSSFAIGAQSGIVNVNMNINNDGAADNKLNINGNIGLSAGLVQQGETNKNTVINIGLSTEDSTLHGIVANNIEEDNEQGFVGEANIYLQNGATWTNEAYGKLPNSWANGSNLNKFVGGSDAAHAGVIIQKDANDINIKKYGGYNVVIYEHTGNGTQSSDYEAGNFIVHSADKDANIVMSTDNTGINIKDRNEVAQVLNALAGKLTYKNFVSGENNLEGKVQIAGGLTGSSAAILVKDITFDKETGKGTYVKPGDDEVVNYTTQIIEDNYFGTTENEFWNSQYVRDDNKNYTFDANTVITVNGNQNPTGHQHGFGVIQWAGNGDGVIDMTGHKLTLNAIGLNAYDHNRQGMGIIVESENLNIKNVNGIDINIKDSYRNRGIYVVGMPSQGNWDNGKSNAHLTIENDDAMEHAVKIRFENCTDTQAGIYVYGNSGTAELDILGNVDIEVGNGGDGIRVEKGDAYIGGGKITAFDVNADALYVRSGNLLINSELSDTGLISAVSDKRDININGDIAVEADRKSSEVSVALNTANSTFKGGIKHVDEGGKVNLLLANKALWENNSQDVKFKGSVVDQFIGGSNKENSGYIKQADSNQLVFNNYSGNTVIMYEHTDNGTDANHYAAGDTIVKKAGKNSGIVLSTQSNGINMQSEDEVTKVLNVLAGKLTYEAFTTGEDHLTGRVQIAEGLTSSSASLKSGRIEFNKDTGKGNYTKETILTFTSPITGKELPGSEYIKENVWKENGNYEFVKNANITINGIDNQAAVDIQEGIENVTIKADKGVLNFDAKGQTANYVTAIKDNRGGTLNIEAAEINISAVNDNEKVGGGAKGIYIQGDSRNGASILNIKGNVNVNACVDADGAGAYGIQADENSVITIDGNLSMKDKNGSWGVTSGSENFDKYVGLYVSQNYNTGKPQTGTITVNGTVDLAVDGIALLADGQGGKININSGGNILVNKDASKLNYAAVAKGGSTINLNMIANDKTAGTEDLKVNGNIGLLKKSYEPAYDTAINIGLSGKKSELNGVIFNEFLQDKDAADQVKGQVNMELANDAIWTNQSYGKVDSKFNGSTVTNFVGGTDTDRAGIIIQKDSQKLTFENFSGYGMVIYEHNGNGTNTSDYIGGDTIVKKAAIGSGIILSTDNKGIDLNDKNIVNNVLNALAGKLTYEAFIKGDTNLSGEVRIASGLTGSSVIEKFGEITFDKETGKGFYEESSEPEVPDHQTQIDFTTAITGKEVNDTEYLYGGVIKKDETGNVKYVFAKDSNININAEAQSPGIDVKDNVVIDASGSSLNIGVASDASTGMGIKQESNKQFSITADRLNIKVDNEAGRAEGLHMFGNTNNYSVKTTINSNVNINANGIGYVLGIYTAGNSVLDINGNVTMKGEGENQWGVDSNGTGSFGYLSTSGIYAGSNYNIQKGSIVNIKGDVDLAINGSGIVANGGGSTVNINGGGNILVNKDSEEIHYALVSTSGNINMNVNKGHTGATKNDVNIKGNIGVTDGAAHKDEPNKDSQINLGLNTNKSQFHGVIVHDFAQENLDMGFNGKVNLYMGNYAVWVNEAYGKTVEGFNGSFVDKFVGGKDTDHAAIIKQKDSNKLTLNNYSGHSVVVYEHDGDGTNTEQYKAGDTVINQASKGSGIVLSTDNTNINYDDAAQVEKVLNALAGKLIYTDAANNTANLSGRVQIASGLTGSEVGKWVGDINYGEGGKGQLAPDSIKPGEGGGSGEVTWGDYENEIMRGVRSAMTGTMMSWRDNAADMFDRTSSLRNGEEKGAWIKMTGGKHKYNGANTELGMNYWGVQFGYDRALKTGWNIGGVVDYRDGNTSFNMGGDGDNKVYSFGVYGSKDLGDNSYIDLTAKVGRAESDFTAYNEIGTKVEGEYNSRGYSLSAQYGKRFTNENGGYFEPQLQLTYAHLDGAKYTAISRLGTLDINQSAYDSFVGRIGIEAGQESENGYYYARLGLAHEFAGDIDATYYAKDGGFKETKFDMGDTWSELTVGANYQISKSSYFYIDLTRGLSGDYKHEWKVNGGLNFTF